MALPTAIWITFLCLNFIRHAFSLHISDDIKFIHRQARRNHPMYDIDDKTKIPVREKFRYLADFVAIHERYLNEFGDKCSISMHKKWSDPSSKSLLSGGKDAFQLDGEWRYKICNIFKYLECKHEGDSAGDTGVCRCASEETVGMKLHFDPYINYKEMFSPEDNNGVRKYDPKLRKKFRFWCRADKGQLCGYVRLVPNRTLPGVDFPYPDIFPCLSVPYDEAVDGELMKSPTFDFSGKGKPEIKNDDTPTEKGRDALKCEHFQIEKKDAETLKLSPEDIGVGLDVNKDKIHAYTCGKKDLTEGQT